MPVSGFFATVTSCSYVDCGLTIRTALCRIYTAIPLEASLWYHGLCFHNFSSNHHPPRELLACQH